MHDAPHPLENSWIDPHGRFTSSMVRTTVSNDMTELIHANVEYVQQCLTSCHKDSLSSPDYRGATPDSSLSSTSVSTHPGT